MDLIYIVLLILALIFLCLRKKKVSKTLLMITLISYLTLVIRDSRPVYAFIVSLLKNGFRIPWMPTKYVFLDFLEILSMSLSLFFTNEKNRNASIAFISITIILFIIAHFNEIYAIFA